MTRLAIATALALLVALAAYFVATGGGSKRFPASDYAGLPAIRSGLLLGANYTHVSFAGCSWTRTGILGYLGKGDARAKLHRQLDQMRRRGVDSLRVLIWHLTDASHELWGPVPSGGGRLSEPYRTNFADFLTEVRRFHFARLTVSFGPVWTNDPLTPLYDPSKFSENWSFISDVRALVRRYGPPNSRFDLLNEGAPSAYLAPGVFTQVTDYLKHMYSRYVHAFGKRDVTVSTIAPESARDQGDRLGNLIRIFDSTGYGQPRWYEIHANYAPAEVVYALDATRRELARNGILPAIVVGEASYDDPRVTRRLQRTPGALRNVQEIIEWFKRPDGSCNVSPPYGVDAYRSLGAGVNRSAAAAPGPAATTASATRSRARDMQSARP